MAVPTSYNTLTSLGGGSPKPFGGPRMQITGPTGPVLAAPDPNQVINELAAGLPPSTYSATGYSPSLIDLGAVRQRYQPNQSVLDQFAGMETSAKNQFGAARNESNRQRDYAVGQTQQINPMASQIYGNLIGGLQGAGAIDNPFANLLGNSVEKTNAATKQAAQLGLAGFQQQAPLLSAGFNEINQRNLGALAQGEAGALQDIAAQRLGYTSALDQALAQALGAAEQYNTGARNSAAEFYAQAQNAANAANADTANRRQETASQRQYETAATQSQRDYENQVRAQEAAAQNPTPSIDQIQSAVNFFYPDPNKAGLSTIDAARGLALSQTNYQPKGSAVKTYNEVLANLQKGMSPEEAVKKASKGQQNSRAASLALYRGLGIPGVTQAFGVLNSGV